jgi:hypothetical protein
MRCRSNAAVLLLLGATAVLLLLGATATLLLLGATAVLLLLGATAVLLLLRRRSCIAKVCHSPQLSFYCSCAKTFFFYWLGAKAVFLLNW